MGRIGMHSQLQIQSHSKTSVLFTVPDCHLYTHTYNRKEVTYTHTVIYYAAHTSLLTFGEKNTIFDKINIHKRWTYLWITVY